MTVLLIVGCAALYLVVGYVSGLWQVPFRVQASCNAWSHVRNSASERQSVAAQWLGAFVFLWPVLLPTYGVATLLMRQAAHLDPLARAERVREQDRRIAQLERELGIGRDR